MMFKKKSKEDQINDTFGLVYQQSFINEEIGDTLKEAFEVDKNEVIIKILENYMDHNDYLEMKNQL